MAAFVIAASSVLAAAGCGMTDTDASARAGREAAALTLAREFLSAKGGDLARLRTAGARIDTDFAGSGSYPLEIPGVAVRGSTLAIDERADRAAVAPETLKLVLPEAPRLTLDTIGATLGTPKRAPALPGAAWLYTVTAAEGRYRIALSGDPAKGARVVSVTAIRER